MPRKLSDRVKRAAGTYRADRETTPKSPAAAQAAVAAAAVALEQAKAQAADLTGRKQAKVLERVRILADDFELALEDSAKAMRQAEVQAAAPSIRTGLELLGYDDCMNASPPLTDDEELEWLRVGPHNEEDLIARRRAAAVPLTVKDASVIKSILAYMEFLAGQRNLTAMEAARLKLFREHLAYFDAQRKD